MICHQASRREGGAGSGKGLRKQEKCRVLRGDALGVTKKERERTEYLTCTVGGWGTWPARLGMAEPEVRVGEPGRVPDTEAS